MGPPAALSSRVPEKKKKTSTLKEQPDDSVAFSRARMGVEGIPVTLGPEDVMDFPLVDDPILVPPAGSAEKSSAEASSADQVFPERNEPKIDIGTVMSQRLSAMRVLQDDPSNVVAFKQMKDAQGMVRVVHALF